MSPRTTNRSLLERFAKRRALARWMRFASRDVWHVEIKELSPWRAFLTRFLRIVLISGRGFERDRCLEKSAALTYMTIFSLPAFMALVFSIAKGFKAYEKLKAGPIDSFLDNAFPVDATGGNAGAVKIRDLVDQIFTYVQTADLTVLTTVGLLFVIYATIKMLASIEAAFNEIWGVQRARTLVRKFADYLSIVLVTPVVLLIGTTFTAFLKTGGSLFGFGDKEFKIAPWLVKPLLTAVPLLSIWLGMSLILLTLPNTRVRIRAALFGGAFAGLLWQIGQYLFFEFQVGLARLNAIFAGFAAVPMLLTWIYLSWIALLIGAQLSAAFQNEQLITSIARTGKTDQRFRESLAPRLAGRIAAAFLAGKEPPTASQLANEVGVAPRTVSDVLDALERHRIVAATTEEMDDGYLPARDPDAITVLDLLYALRREKGVEAVPSRDRLDERVDRILYGFDTENRASLHNYTLRELAQALSEEEREAQLGTEAEPLPASEPPSA